MKIAEVESEARNTKALAQAEDSKFKEAARKVKELEGLARRAKSQLKRAKKDSKRAAKAARASRDAAGEAQKASKKAKARADKAQAKLVKARSKITAQKSKEAATTKEAPSTPSGRARIRGKRNEKVARRSRPRRAAAKAPVTGPPGVDFDAEFSVADLSDSDSQS